MLMGRIVGQEIVASSVDDPKNAVDDLNEQRRQAVLLGTPWK